MVAGAPFLKRTWPEGSLPAVLEPWIRVAVVDVQRWPDGPAVRITGSVKGPETVGDTGADIDGLIGSGHQRFIDGLARATRETMYRQAEDAIAAALGAGWVLVRHPEIRVRGEINRDQDTEVDVPCAEVRVELWFRPPRPAGGRDPGG